MEANSTGGQGLRRAVVPDDDDDDDDREAGVRDCFRFTPFPARPK